ncbi:MAG: response regulator transcription factor [Chryseobacterium sp.]|nr:MAG: response regulator transcription factor [Chryseobacterium sp.]
MRIVIIEDEKLMADYMAETIQSIEPKAIIVATLRSVKESVAYFKSKDAPDLIFSDIQLGDGLSFEIFSKVTVTAPIIFCTAFDSYAMDAFKTNGIDYIMKPFTDNKLKQSLQKYKSLKSILASQLSVQYEAILALFKERQPPRAETLLVYHLNRILPLKIDNVAVFYIENEIVSVLMISGDVYYPNKTLEELEKLCGSNFFRANRQVLVNRQVVLSASRYFSRKMTLNLSVPFKDIITVSKERTSLLAKWLEKK